MAHEALTGLEMEIAAAVHNCGGKVIVQVEELMLTRTEIFQWRMRR